MAAPIKCQASFTFSKITMIEDSPFTERLYYIAKLVAGLVLLGVVIAVATDSWLIDHIGLKPTVVIPVLTLMLFGLAPIVRIIYRRMDELNRSLHRQACAISLPLIACGCGVVGLLQAHELLPLFNQLWMLFAAIGCWGIALMLCDRQYR
jgi:hypothetical protein